MLLSSVIICYYYDTVVFVALRMMLGGKLVSYYLKISSRCCSYSSKRWMSKAFKELELEKLRTTGKALSHFDEFYGSIFQEQWPSIRVALLSPQKKGAVINNFSDIERVSQKLQDEGAYNVRLVYEEQQRNLKDKIDEDLTEVYQVEGRIEDVLLRQQRVDFDEIYLEPLESVTNEVLRNSENQSVQKREENIDDESPAPSEDPTKDQPLAETLKTADYDRSRIINPGQAGLQMSASLYEFVPATKLKGMDDFIPESTHYAYYKDASEAPFKVEAENHIEFPPFLNVYAFERGNCDTFKHSEKGVTDVLDYHIINLGSLAPVLALGMKREDIVLDLTSNTLDIPILIAQTLAARMFVANCENTKQSEYLLDKLKSHVIDVGNDDSTIFVTDYHPLEMEEELFDKIILTVPSTYDRRSVMVEQNNVFRPSNIQERIKLPEQQVLYLRKALQLVKEGGSVVYFTESLSPIQNDAVVQRALDELWIDSCTSFTIKDMSKGLAPLQPFMKITKTEKFGHLVVPFLPNNCGPLYFSKIVKDHRGAQETQ